MSTIEVKVIPNAKIVQVKKEVIDGGRELYKVFVNQSAEKGKANKAVLALLAKHLDVSISNLTIVQGTLNRRKIVKINAD